MKNLPFIVLSGCIPFMVVTNSAHAQNSNNMAKLDQPNPVIKMGITIAPEKENIADLKNISAKAQKNFRKSFKTISSEKWLISEDGFAATFALNDMNNVIYYSKDGHWFGSLKVYTEEKLARNIRDIVRRKYYDYKIICVQEIETINSQGMATFIVQIEDGTHLKFLRISDGAMDLYREFEK